MAPKRKRCCVPYCDSVQGLCKKQFFRIGTDLEGRDKLLSLIGKTTAAKSQVLYCCEDHFDLPNDAENYIRFKYISGTKLRLRPNVLPQKKLPSNVCRLCLKLIFNGDDFVDISSKKGAENAEIIASTLPEIDLSITSKPVVCVECFRPLKEYHRMKQKALNSEIMVVNCIKTIVKRSPTRLLNNCEIDLFKEYNDIRSIMQKEKEKVNIPPQDQQAGEETLIFIENNPDPPKQSVEEIIMKVEDRNEPEYKIEIIENKYNTLPEEDPGYKLAEEPSFGKHNLTLVENSSFCSEMSESPHVSTKSSEFPRQNIVELQNMSNKSAEHGENLHYEGDGVPMEGHTDNIYIHVEKESTDNVIIVSQQL